MIGDGVESNYLVTFFVEDFKYSDLLANNIILFYGVFVAIGSWLSGVLSTLLSPKRVMLIGAVIWAVFEVLFLAVGIPTRNVAVILLSYGIRGLGYPLFAFAFLTWINRAVRREDRGTAGGWFWFMFTGGLPVIGTAVAAVAIPRIGQYATFWLSLGLVVVGAAVAVLGAREAHGTQRISAADTSTAEELRAGISILWRYPKVGRLAAARCINTGPSTASSSRCRCSCRTTTRRPGSGVLADRLPGLRDHHLRGERRDQPDVGSHRRPVRLAQDRDLRRRPGLRGRHPARLLRPVGLPHQLRAARDRRRPVRHHPGGLRPAVRADHLDRARGRAGQRHRGVLAGRRASTVLGPLVYPFASPLLGTVGVMIVFAVLYVVSAVMTYRIWDAADPGEDVATRGAGTARA